MTTTPPDNAGLAGMYRKKPIAVAAVQWWPSIQLGHFEGEKYVNRRIGTDAHGVEYTVCDCCLRTLEGPMNIRPGDWIITGVKGERYPCRADIFEATYEPAAALRPSVWMDISTAPKDGTRFVVTSICSDGKYGGSVLTAYYHAGKWRIPWDNSLWDLDDFDHWMPLPTPPKAPTP